MRYQSKLTEIEAMRWGACRCAEKRGLVGCVCAPCGCDGSLNNQKAGADQIVAWVNANGGEARYDPESWPFGRSNIGHDACIAVRTINGWAYASPGDYVVMGTALIPNAGDDGRWKSPLRDFYPCDPETFESRWERKS